MPLCVLLAGVVLSAGHLPSGRGEEPKRKHLHDPLPATNHWDLKELQALGTILTTRHDKEGNRIIWVLETAKLDRAPRLAPMFFDDEGSFLATGDRLEFTRMPKEKDEKKDRIKVVLKLPSKSVLQETFRVVLKKPPF
jgi:hypothetical protein